MAGNASRAVRLISCRSRRYPAVRRSNAASRGTTLAMSDKIEPGRPTAQSQYENRTAGDHVMEADLTEERDVTPQQRSDVADDQHMDP